MMTNSPDLVTWRTASRVLMPRNPDKDVKSRLGYYLDWLAQTRRAWYQPDLRAYRDYLLHERTRIHPRSGKIRSATLAPATVQSHLATIRGRYNVLLRDNTVRDALYDLSPSEASPADRKAFVDELLVRLQNAVHPATAPVKTLTRQDQSDQDHLRLKPHQVRALLRAPGIRSIKGRRDTAMLAMLVCTGIREAELCDLRVQDLRHSMNDELSLFIRSGKGYKQRLIPYGPLDWCLLYVDHWLAAADIQTGPVFRGFYRGYKTIRKTAITTRQVNRLLNSYPILIDGELREVKPHDLRRTYAYNAYSYGLDMERIRQNLGHADLNTTQTYIGQLDAGERRPPEMYAPPHKPQDLIP